MKKPNVTVLPTYSTWMIYINRKYKASQLRDRSVSKKTDYNRVLAYAYRLARNIMEDDLNPHTVKVTKGIFI